MLFSLLKTPTTSIVYWESTTKYLISWTYTIYTYKANLALQTYENEDILGILEFWGWVIYAQLHGFLSHTVYNIIHNLLFCNKVLFAMISLPKETARTCNKAKVLNACLSQMRLQRPRDQNEVLLGQTCRTRAFAWLPWLP